MKNLIKKLALVAIGVAVGRVIERKSFKDFSGPIPDFLSDP